MIARDDGGGIGDGEEENGLEKDMEWETGMKTKEIDCQGRREGVK